MIIEMIILKDLIHFCTPKFSLQKPLSLTLLQDFTSFSGDFATIKVCDTHGEATICESKAPRNPLVLGHPILPVWRNAVGHEPGQGVFFKSTA